MGVTYSWAPEVQVIAETLIPRHHNHLISEEIRFVFRSEAAKNGGRIVLGKARKVSGFNAFLGTVSTGEILDDGAEPPPFFVIEIAQDMWLEMTEHQRRALVDHELSHCDIQFNDAGVAQLVIKGHDVEEFARIIERHGLWKPDVRAFIEIGARQLDLFDEQPEPRAAGTLALAENDAPAAAVAGNDATVTGNEPEVSASGEDSSDTVLQVPPETDADEVFEELVEADGPDDLREAAANG